ncbi:MAG: Holliday junction ATP-dependent DNA helicase RuvA [Syntrophomonadaceae bacterium]|nr:Holliday junction ATP-dependent DNA helicase RuvA [Bacillota bacterium]
MIDFLKGKIETKFPTYVILEVGGVGYGVHIPISTYNFLPGVNEQVTLHTFLYVREDCLHLYGFYSNEEKELFEMLISTSGVGPRIALGILSATPVSRIKEAINEEDIPQLMTIPGVGKKTAQRLVIELKEKIGVSLTAKKTEETARAPDEIELINDAISALVSLGCKRVAAVKVVKERYVAAEQALTLEELIKEALKYL